MYFLFILCILYLLSLDEMKCYHAVVVFMSKCKKFALMTFFHHRRSDIIIRKQYNLKTGSLDFGNLCNYSYVYI